MDLKFVHKERKPWAKKKKLININKYIKLEQIEKLIKIIQFNIETYISLYIIGQNSYNFFKMF